MGLNGLKTRVTAGGVPVVSLHYTADPAKSPETEDGRTWLASALQGYPGGLDSPRWRKEMELDWGALGGQRVFPAWERWRAAGKIVIAPFVPTGYRLYGSYDHGFRTPAAFHVHGINGDGLGVTLWETYGAGIPVSEMSRIILGQAVRLTDGRQFPGNPFAGQLTYIVADPSMWAEDTPMLDEPMKSTAALFRRYGVYLQAGERGADVTVAEWLLGHYWADPENPLWRITMACPKLCWELGRLRHKELSPTVAQHRDQPEALVDKDNHAWDGLKMFLKRFPPSPAAKKPVAAPNTFTWWQQQLKRQQAGQALRTFRREMVG